MSPERNLRVLVVDDHDVVHWGFRLLLTEQPWVERCLTASNAEEALDLARRYEPHVALVDLFLGEESGAELCEAIRRESPTTRVLLISGAGWISPQAAKAAGAPPASSPRTGRPTTWRGRCAWSAGDDGVRPRAEQPAAPLSDREREVLTLMASGATNKEIAERLFLSPHTVKEHTSALYRKLNVRNRAEAVQRAERLGLTSDKPPPTGGKARNAETVPVGARKDRRDGSQPTDKPRSCSRPGKPGGQREAVGATGPTCSTRPRSPTTFRARGRGHAAQPAIFVQPPATKFSANLPIAGHSLARSPPAGPPRRSTRRPAPRAARGRLRGGARGRDDRRRRREREPIEQVAETGLTIANDNAPDQSLRGRGASTAASARASARCAQAAPVGGAFHPPLMEPAVRPLQELRRADRGARARVPVLSS